MPDVPLDPDSAVITRWVIALWMGLFGAAIGSFLNVVVYRLPRGMSLSYPGSHCPKCDHAIRWHDNVPVLGWLWLKGRCRDCRAPISPRYPLVEAVVAVMFAALAACELTAGSQWMRMVDADQARLAGPWGTYALHCLLLSTLVAAALIELDRQRPPLKLFWPVLVAGCLLPLVWIDLRTTPVAEPLPELLAAQLPVLAIVEGVAGIAVGSLFAGLVWPAIGLDAERRPDRTAITAELAAIGCCLGWQSVPGIATGAVLCYLATLLLPRRWPWHGCLSLALASFTMADLVIASQQNAAERESSWDRDLQGLLFCGTLTAILAVTCRLLAMRSDYVSRTAR